MVPKCPVRDHIFTRENNFTKTLDFELVSRIESLKWTMPINFKAMVQQIAGLEESENGRERKSC